MRHGKKYPTISNQNNNNNNNNVTLRSPIPHKNEQQELQILQDLVEDIEDQNYIQQLEEKENEDDEEIEMEWRKPSWKRAIFVEADSRPHHAGEKMERYNWKTTTTGRHCIFSGCGEQLDLWDEGQLSEFTQFGSGITNYFKVRIEILIVCEIRFHTHKNTNIGIFPNTQKYAFLYC